MKNLFVLILGIFVLNLSFTTQANFSDKKIRSGKVKQFSEKFKQEKAEAKKWAENFHQKIRFENSKGTLFELMKIKNGCPIFFITLNHNAAISTAANLVRNTSPYNLNGTNMTAGVWDGGSVLSTHQEFDGRVTVKDGASSHYHSTHVGGTIAARGVVENAKGMAPEIKIDSYDWNDDNSEMANCAASAPNQADKIYISNHSYGIGAGWVWGAGGENAWYWLYNLSTMEDKNFGRYGNEPRDWDDIVYNAPYYLIVKAASNDRSDGPSNGDTFYYDSWFGWSSETYDDTQHPLGDGIYYHNGYDTIPIYGVAKNILTVGAVRDAVSSGNRNLANATMTSFSSWGPADDGRIKPDVVGNGYSLYSCYNNADNSYAWMSGTSMASPNVCGSAALLIDLCRRNLGGEKRASTIKAVIIHTADDLGRPGPDYSFGWGLMNTKAAADTLLRGFDLSDLSTYIYEQLLDDPNPVDTYSINIDNLGQIKATLCWTDPAGTATSTHNDRTPVLVNDLDLRVVAPDGTTNYPFVLDVENPENPAVTGDNIVDNVEQVLISNVVASGTYKVIVSRKGSLSLGGGQYYSLVISAPVPEPVIAFFLLLIVSFLRRKSKC